MALSREIAELIISLEGQITDLKKDLSTASGDLDKFKKKNDTLLKGIKKNWKGYAAAIVATGFAIRKLVTPFASFTHRMYEVNTLANLSVKNFKAFSKEILDMTSRVPQSARELADALYDIVSAGVAVGDATSVLELSAKAAVAGVTTTQTAARVGLAVINAYGKEITELESVYDTLFQTVKKGVITFEELSSGLGAVLPNAIAAKTSIEDIAGSIATMTKLGIPSAIAFTSLRSGLVKLAAPGEEARIAMKKLNIEWKGWIPTLKQIHDAGLDLRGMRSIIPDERAGKAVLSLSQNIELLEDTMRNIDDSKDSMKTAYAIMQKSPVNQVKQLTNAITELGIQLVAAFSPAVLATLKPIIGILRIASLQLQGYSFKTIQLFEYLNHSVLPILRTQEAKLNFLQEQRLKLIKEEFKIRTKIRNQSEAAGPTASLGLQNYTKDLEDVKFRYGLVNDALLRLGKTQKELLLDDDDKDKDKKPKGLGASIQADTKIVIESLQLLKAQSKALLADIEREFETNQISISEYYEARKQDAQSVFDAEVNSISNLILKYDEENIRLKELLKTTKEDADKKKILNTLRDNENKQRQARIDLETKEISLKTKLNELTDEETKKTKDISESIQNEINQKLFSLKEDSRQKELDAEEEWFNERLEKLKKYGLSYNALYIAHKQSIKDINDRYNDLDKEDIEKNLALQTEAINYIASTLKATLSTFLDTKIKKLEQARNKELALVNSTIQGQEAQQKASQRINAEFDKQARALGERKKRLALAEAAVNMSKSAIGAYSAYADIDYIGPALGYAAALAAIAFGTAQMNDIRNTQFYKEGGSVHGPGGIDNINARLTNREFVEPVSSVDYYGADVFEAMRQRAIPREVFSAFTGMQPKTSGRFFQDGGLAVAQQNDSLSNSLQINNIVDPDLLGDYLTTEQGQDMIVNVITNRAYEIRTRLNQT